MLRLRAFALAASALLVWVSSAVAQDSSAPTEYPALLRFEARMGNEPIGFQSFAFERLSSEKLKVNIRAEFKVAVFGVYPYRYVHENEEIWENRCLHSLNSRTHSGGSHQRVEGQASSKGFTVARAEKKSLLLPKCVASFPYWDKALLADRESLLNSQTGKYAPITVTKEGAGAITLGGKSLTTEQVRLRSGNDLDILLQYHGEHWVALDSVTWNGKVLQLRRLTPLPAFKQDN